MGNVKFDYNKVDNTTKSIKSNAKENLKTYANTEYKTLKEAMKTSKGDYKTAIMSELEAEKNTVKAVAEFIIKIQDMMKETADAFKETDASYTKGAAFSDK